MIAYLTPDGRSLVTEGVAEERPLLDVDLRLHEDGGKEEAVQQRRGEVQELHTQPGEATGETARL